MEEYEYEMYILQYFEQLLASMGPWTYFVKTNIKFKKISNFEGYRQINEWGMLRLLTELKLKMTQTTTLIQHKLVDHFLASRQISE